MTDDNGTALAKLEHQLKVRTLNLQLSLIEAQQIQTNFVDPRDAFRDEFGTDWLPIFTQGSHKRGDKREVFSNEQMLDTIRQRSRHLAAHNEFAINVLENRVSYIVGTGLSYNPISRDEDDTQEQLVAEVSEFLEAFDKVNKWGRREQESVRRTDRDGEYFIERFPQMDGMTLVRFIEPEDVRQPKDRVEDSNWSYGIRTKPGDVETVLQYNVAGRGLVEPVNVHHVKANVDSNVKRGLSSFYPVRKNLERAEKLLRNMSLVAQTQAAIALVRKHSNTKGQVDAFTRDQSDYDFTDANTGKIDRWKRIIPPAIIDLPKGMEFDYPSSGIDPEKFVAALQADLRATASRFVMPEFMLTAKSDDVNRAAALVAESPAHKNFERLQAFHSDASLEVITAAVAHAASMRLLPENTLDRIRIDVVAPTLVVREFLAEQQGRKVQKEARVLSIRTWQELSGLDPDTENQNIEQEDARNPNPFPLTIPIIPGREDDDE